MAFYVKNNEDHEITKIVNLSDLHTWSGATDRIMDVFNAGLEEELLIHLEDYAPQISEDGLPLWTKMELNNYLWYDKSWRRTIGLLNEDDSWSRLSLLLKNNRTE